MILEAVSQVVLVTSSALTVLVVQAFASSRLVLESGLESRILEVHGFVGALHGDYG